MPRRDFSRLGNLFFPLAVDTQLVPVLRQLYDSLAEPRTLTAGELPFGEFLREQGALSWEPPRPLLGLALEPHVWLRRRAAGLYELAGDGEGGAWRYLYQPGQSACLHCLLRWWIERFHGPEWWPRMQMWPDFRWSWPASEIVLDAPLGNGWLPLPKWQGELSRPGVSSPRLRLHGRGELAKHLFIPLADRGIGASG